MSLVVDGLTIKDLDTSQVQALEKAWEWWKKANTPEFSIGGLAGTGKSTIIKFLIHRINERYFSGENSALTLNKTNLNVVFITLTGKAALVLRRKGMYAETIHSFMYKAIVDNETEEIFFVKKQFEDFQEVDLIVVDEASMVGREITQDLRSLGIPIIFVGDHGQLGPVTKEGEEKFNLMDNADIYLNEIHRQALDNPIIYLSMLAREGKYIPNKFYSKTVAKVPASKLTINGILKRDQIIVARHKTRNFINNVMREKLGFTNSLPETNDKIICTRNNWKQDLINGQVGRCLRSFEASFNEGKFKMDFMDDGGRVYHEVLTRMHEFLEGDFEHIRGDKSENRPNHFDFGYAITCHKSQGSQFECPIIIDEPFGSSDEMKSWRYTAITRAIDGLIIVDNAYKNIKWNDPIEEGLKEQFFRRSVPRN